MKKFIKYLYFPVFLSFFAFTPITIWGAKMAPASAAGAELGSVTPELLKLFALRAEVIAYAIEASIEHNAHSESCMEILKNKKRIQRIEQQAYAALNEAEAAYLMANKRTQSKLDIIENTLCSLVCQKLGAQNLLTYGKIKKIVQDNVVRSELPASVRRNLSLMMQNAAPLEALFEIKDDCLRPEFITYTNWLQGFYTKKSLELGLPDKKLFLESLGHSDNLVQIFRCLCMAKVRNIIELAYNAGILENTPQGRSSKAIEEFRKRKASAIAEERQKVYVRLLSIEEIKAMISEYTRALSPVLQERILSLVNPENAATLTHYAFIWEAKCRIAGEHFGSLFIDSAAEIEYLRKTFSGLDPKSVQAGANAENIWPNLLSRLRDCGVDMLLKVEAPQAVVDKAPQAKKMQPSRELPAMAKELIAEEDARKRKQAQLKAAQERAAEERRLEAERKAQAAYRAEKKKQKKTKPQDAHPEEALSPEQSYAPESHEVKELEQKDLVPEKQAQDPLVTPLDPQVAAAAEPEEDDDDEDIFKLYVAEQQPIQVQFELPNSTDKIYKQYNCIWDLSRDATGSYQCKIFLHPEISASGENFLANLDYSRLAKYKNPRDNNHAFSNLVEKEFGYLGNVVERKETGSGWIVMRITFPGTITWMGHKMSDACQLRTNGTFEFVIMKKDMNPESYARCVHRFFRPNK